jgi:hypothetical protein
MILHFLSQVPQLELRCHHWPPLRLKHAWSILRDELKRGAVNVSQDSRHIGNQVIVDTIGRANDRRDVIQEPTDIFELLSKLAVVDSRFRELECLPRDVRLGEVFEIMNLTSTPSLNVRSDSFGPCFALRICL